MKEKKALGDTLLFWQHFHFENTILAAYVMNN